MILSEAHASSAINRLYAYIDLKEPVFAIHASISLAGRPTKIVDFANIQPLRKGGVRILAESDFYMPKLLRLLWGMYGREKISQPSRYEVIIEAPTNAEEICKLVVYDPKEELLKRILDTLYRMIPEGFRVKHSAVEENEILIVASEDPIKPSWITKAKEIMRKNP